MATKKRGRPTKKELEARRAAEARSRRAAQRKTASAVALMAFGAFFCALAFLEGEAVWLTLHRALFGVLGLLAYALGPVLFLLGILQAAKRSLDGGDAARWTLLALSLSGASYIFSVARPSGDTADAVIRDLYRMGTDKIGTGLVSALLGWPLDTWFGAVGAKVTISVLCLAALMLVSGKTPVDLWKLIKWPFAQLGAAISELRDAARERREAEAAEEASLAHARAAEGFEEKAKRIDIPLDDAKKKRIDIPLDEPVAFSPEKESRIAARAEKLPAIDVDLGPAFDPAAEGIALDPTGPAGPVVKEVLGRSAAEAAEQAQLFAQFDKNGVPLAGAAAAATFSEAESRLKQRDEELGALAKKADSEYLKNALAPGMELKQDRKEARVYKLPPASLLNKQVNRNEKSLEAELSQNAELLVKTLASFGVQTKVINISRGPAVTRYELQPEVGVRLSRIVNLADDIALNLAATSVRIEAPIPGKAAVGIEIPNRNVQVVNLRPVIESEEFQRSKSPLTYALGKDVSGAVKVDDIEKMPHLLIAGATGMGKSVCINSILISLLYKCSPDELKLILVDPKMVEFNAYNGLPHLYVPVVTDPRKAAGALGWAVSEMLKRYRLFSETNCRNITEYNAYVDKTTAAPGYEPPEGEEEPQRLPRVVIVIDELADLMMVAPNEVEDAIARLAQMARAAGMHLILATQRPSVDVITGVIKNNIPSRIAFAVSSQVDSRTILDGAGAEKLLGRGDMLYMPVGRTKATRIQGCFVTNEEVEAVVGFIKKNTEAQYDDAVVQEIDRQAAKEKGKGGAAADDADGDGEDDMFEAAVEVVLDAGQASTSLLQRRLRLGYARAARIMDEMEQRGIISPPEGSKPRQLRITKQQWLERTVTRQDG